MTYETFETSETSHLVPSRLGRESDSCDLEATQTNSSSDHSESQGGSTDYTDWRQCWWHCLGPIFGWLGFSILDGWWPERPFSAADYALYQTQQNHIKHVECITRAMKGKFVRREELRRAVLSFGRDQSAEVAEVTCAELKAMFYFAECQQDGRLFLSFLQANLDLEAWNILVFLNALDTYWYCLQESHIPTHTLNFPYREKASCKLGR